VKQTYPDNQTGLFPYNDINPGVVPQLHSLLIVEDDESHIELIRRAFETAPRFFNITFVSTLKEAQQYILESPPDLIVADWLLPDGKGADLISFLKNNILIPVIMMTSHGNEKLAVEMMKAGAIDYLVKSDSTFMSMPHIVKSAWIEWNSKITQEKMSTALDESEFKYREIFNNINDAIHIHALSASGEFGKFIEVNDVASRMLRYTPDELHAMSPPDITTGFHSRPVSEILHEIISEGHSTFETEHRRKDGVIIPVEVNAHKVELHGNTFVLSVVRDIRERKHAEAELKNQHSLLKGVLESTTSAVFSLDQDYRYTSFNSRHAETMKMLYGKEIELGKSIFGYQSVDEDQRRAKRNIDRALSGEQFTEEAYSGVGDSRRYFEVSHNPVKNPDNSIIGVAVFAQDTTDRKLAEIESRKSSEKYQTLIESANEGIIILQGGKIPYANPKAQEIIGYPAEDLAGKNFIELVHSEDRKETIERHQKRMKGESFESVTTLRVIDKKGVLHWLEVNAVLIQWNEKPATLNFITDISKRKKAEEALRESEEKYRSVIEHMQDVFYRTDTSGMIIMASPSIGRVLGYHAVEEYLNKPITMFYREPETRNAFLERIVDNGFVENFPVEFKKKDGTAVIISASSHYYYDNAGNILGVEGILRDVTSQKEAEAALRDSLQEKEILLKEIHHRVKNNLQIVSGLLYLESRRTDDTGTKIILESCRDRVSSMALLHESLYQVSSSLASVKVFEYVTTLVQYLNESYNSLKNIGIFVTIPKDTTVDIDTGNALGLILTELLTNILKYAFPNGGSGTVLISMERSGQNHVLTIKDNGVGLPEGFDFSKSPNLGMKLVTNLVRQINGSLQVNGTGGTTITISFPSAIRQKGR
jgi:PAS domain S-box-containing protein